MKKIFYISIISILSFISCKKNNGNTNGTSPFNISNNNNNNNNTPIDSLLLVGPLPTNYTKKVILEEFTGEWCGWCPEGAEVMKSNLSANPNTVIGIAVHDGDPMEIPSFNSWIKTLTNVSGFPNGSVDRLDATGRGYWTGQINNELTKVADLGMAMISKSNGSTIDIKVFVGYKVLMGNNYRLTIAITEDDVPQSSPGAQSNYSAVVVVDPNTWTHSHVLRGFITNEQGDAINLSSPKKYTIVDFKNIDISSMNIIDMSKVQISTFIHTNTLPREVFNAQMCKTNEIKKWD